MKHATPSPEIANFGTLRERLHQPPTHLNWLSVLECLRAASLLNTEQFTREMYPYAEHVLTRIWPQKLLRLSIRETNKFELPYKFNLLGLARHGVTRRHTSEFVHHMKHCPEVFVDMVDLGITGSDKDVRLLELLSTPLRMRGLRLEQSIESIRPIVAKLLAHDQPYLTRLELRASLTVEQWRTLCRQPQRAARFEHLNLRNERRVDELAEVLAAAPLDALEHLTLRGGQSHASESPHMLDSLCGAPWFGQLKSLHMGEQGHIPLDDAVWQRALDVIEDSSALVHLQIYGWRLSMPQIAALCRAVEGSALKSLHLESLELDEEKLSRLFSTQFPTGFQELHVKGEALTHAQVIALASRANVRHVNLNLNNGSLNKLAALAAHPHRGQTLHVPSLAHLEVLTVMEAWSHVEYLLMGSGNDNALHALLKADEAPHLRTVDVSAMNLSQGMWEALFDDPRYGDGKVEFVGSMSAPEQELQRGVYEVIEQGATSLVLPTHCERASFAWVCAQPWLGKLEQLDIQMYVGHEEVMMLEQAWAQGRLSSLKALHLNKTAMILVQHLRLLHGEMASQIDLTMGITRDHTQGWLAGHTSEITVRMEDVEQGVLDLMVEHQARRPVHKLMFHSHVTNQEPEHMALFEQLEQFTNLEQLEFTNIRVDVCAMTAWVLKAIPDVKVLGFYGTPYAAEVTSQLLALDGITRLKSLMVYVDSNQGSIDFQDKFRELKSQDEHQVPDS